MSCVISPPGRIGHVHSGADPEAQVQSALRAVEEAARAGRALAGAAPMLGRPGEGARLRSRAVTSFASGRSTAIGVAPAMRWARRREWRARTSRA